MGIFIIGQQQLARPNGTQRLPAPHPAPTRHAPGSRGPRGVAPAPAHVPCDREEARH